MTPKRSSWVHKAPNGQLPTKLLAKYVWKLKKMGLKYSIKWSIIKHAKPYRKGAHYCYLCLTEKVVIALADASYVNKRSEINSKCRHANQFKLSYMHPP